MDLFGDIAGIYELIIGFLGTYISLFSKISFNIEAIQKMYFVKTKEKELFKQ